MFLSDLTIRTSCGVVHIKEVFSLVLKPGDAVFVHVPKDSAKERFKEVKRVLQELFPNNRVLVCPDDIRITKISDISEEDFNESRRTRREDREEEAGRTIDQGAVGVTEG
jgi:hypothetical protein